MARTTKQLPTGKASSAPAVLSFLDRLTQNMERCSVGQRQIADTLLNHPDDAAFWNAANLAERAKVSEATVVRFAQFLGYEGFPEMRQALTVEARQRIAKQAGLLHAPPGAAATLVEIARRDISNIERTVGQVNERMLEAAVDRILKSRHRVMIGRGISQHMAELLGYLLTLAGLPSISGEASDLSLQVANLGPEDLLVAFSFHPYAKETLEAVAFARERKVPVMAFTDRMEAPLVVLSDHTLLVPGENLMYSHSIVAFAVLANAIVTAVAGRDRIKSLQRLRSAERVATSEFYQG
jgi:DNA-binding MurR/RpiR family transcriptional regulator